MRKRVTTVLAATAAVSAIATATAFAHTELKSTYPGKNKTASTPDQHGQRRPFTAAIRSGSITVTGPERHRLVRQGRP